MGRKPIASKILEKFHTFESANPDLKGETPHLEMQMNVTLAGETPQLEMQANPSSLSSSRKRAKNQTVVVRRSGRLQSAFRPTQRKDVEPMIEEIDISESEKEDEPRVHEKENFPLPTQDERSLEDKFDSVLEAQKETLEALKSKRPKISFKSQALCRTDVQYRSLYFESQKKIETLIDENFKLSNKLENALGKLEVYEKGPYLLSETLEKLKDMILISSMTNTTKAAINLSCQAILGSVPSPDDVSGAKTLPDNKRKKRAKKGKKICDI